MAVSLFEFYYKKGIAARESGAWSLFVGSALSVLITAMAVAIWLHQKVVAWIRRIGSTVIAGG
jgi:hypothetical protein